MKKYSALNLIGLLSSIIGLIFIIISIIKQEDIYDTIGTIFIFVSLILFLINRRKSKKN